VGRRYELFTPTSIDSEIAAIALRQQGNITHRQLISLGLSKSDIAYRVRIGRLYRVYRGVYSVGKRAATPLARASAAVLASGPGAALGYGSAMTLWGFYKHWDTPFEVAVPADRRPKGIRVHRSTTLARRDIKTQLGIRVTSPARTAYDMAPRLKQKTLTRVINDGLRGYLKPEPLAEIVARFPNSKASHLLRPFIEHIGGPTRSELENRFLNFCADHHLPTPITNITIAGYLVDAYFPDHGLIIEIDGWDYHNTRQAFESDRNRDADTLLAGLATIRITAERMKNTPGQEADRLRRILEAQRLHPTKRPKGRLP
jgi:Transcriptional regulator, AbiEi antitoxin